MGRACDWGRGLAPEGEGGVPGITRGPPPLATARRYFNLRKKNLFLQFELDTIGRWYAEPVVCFQDVFP